MQIGTVSKHFANLYLITTYCNSTNNVHVKKRKTPDELITNFKRKKWMGFPVDSQAMGTILTLAKAKAPEIVFGATCSHKPAPFNSGSTSREDKETKRQRTS